MDGIRAHFDVGDPTGFPEPWRYPSDYLVGSGDPSTNVSGLASGGELIEETACARAFATCQFPGWPGTVAWKSGFHTLKNAPVKDGGGEIVATPTETIAAQLADWNNGASAGTIDFEDKRRRFDKDRSGLFRYVLYAHSRGKPVSPFPCLLGAEGKFYNVDSDLDGIEDTCGTAPQHPEPGPLSPNAQFHIPKSTSGGADLPGANVLITLGQWPSFGTPYVQAATTFHELGHNLNLWHGGLQADWGDKALGEATILEPNCKPNHLSSMSYLFQQHGLFNDAGEIRIDYSRAQFADMDEFDPLNDGSLSSTAAYQPAWFAPVGQSLANSLGITAATAATRYCGGQPFGTNPNMARVYLPTPGTNPSSMDNRLARRFRQRQRRQIPPTPMRISMARTSRSFRASAIGISSS